jgi:hypothetical protein
LLLGNIYMWNAIFWDVTSCGFCKNRHSSETSVLTRARLRNIPEDGILHNQRRKYLKSWHTYMGIADGNKLLKTDSNTKQSNCFLLNIVPVIFCLKTRCIVEAGVTLKVWISRTIGEDSLTGKLHELVPILHFRELTSLIKEFYSELLGPSSLSLLRNYK